MTESARISQAEAQVRQILEEAGHPVSSADFAKLLPADASRSLIRLALQRMIAGGSVGYDAQRRYSLVLAAQPAA
jgi:hypothetical protein